MESPGRGSVTTAAAADVKLHVDVSASSLIAASVSQLHSKQEHRKQLIGQLAPNTPALHCSTLAVPTQVSCIGIASD
jgi:hypothetical protein